MAVGLTLSMQPPPPTPWWKRLRIGPISNWFAPGYGACMRCRTNWGFVEGHTTWFSEWNGMFPLCEACWAELTPDQRLPFYARLFQEWGSHAECKWSDTERAVRAEGAAEARSAA